MVELFFGRLHPLLVHLPIGILILACLFEWLSHLKRFNYLRATVRPSLLVGSLAAIFSCLTGLFLSKEGGYSESTLRLHQYFGIATAVMSTGLFFAIRKLATKTKSRRRYVPALLFIPIAALLGITGHLGGSMTHGEEYLSLSGFARETGDVVFQPIAHIDKAVLYTDVVQPILKAKCYSCHSTKKQKGDLRLDGIDFIIAGGEHGAVVIEGLPDSSSLYTRMILPPEDEDHMPPKEKRQLIPAEIAIIEKWIADGANVNKEVQDYADAGTLKMQITTLQTPKDEHWLPAANPPEPDAGAVTELGNNGIHITPVAQDNRYLMASFVNTPKITDEDMKRLLELRAQLVWLSLDGTSVTDDQLAVVADLPELRYLYLNNTGVADKGMEHLAKLPELLYLNLVNTRITDKGLEQLSASRTLRKLFLYRTETTASGITSLLQKLPECAVDTGGYSLPALATDTIIFKRSI